MLSGLSLALFSILDCTAQGFSISPARIFLSGSAGETLSTTITLNNTSQKKLSFNTRIQDWDRDSLGSKRYYPAKTLANSNSDWLSLTTNTISLMPGETQLAVLTMQVPEQASRQTTSMVFFTQVEPQEADQENKRAVGIQVLMEVGVQVYFTPKNIRQGELEFLKFQDRGIPTKGSSRKVAIKVNNNGLINKDAFIRMELTNKETGEEIKIAPVMLAMLPESTQWIYFDLPANLKGTYLAVAMLDAGKNYDLKVAEKDIIYSP